MGKKTQTALRLTDNGEPHVSDSRKREKRNGKNEKSSQITNTKARKVIKAVEARWNAMDPLERQFYIGNEKQRDHKEKEMADLHKAIAMATSRNYKEPDDPDDRRAYQSAVADLVKAAKTYQKTDRLRAWERQLFEFELVRLIEIIAQTVEELRNGISYDDLSHKQTLRWICGLGLKSVLHPDRLKLHQLFRVWGDRTLTEAQLASHHIFITDSGEMVLDEEKLKRKLSGIDD